MVGTCVTKDEITELEDWPPTVADPVRDAIGQLLVAIIENTSEGSPEKGKSDG
jgi:hypothetical protein